MAFIFMQWKKWINLLFFSDQTSRTARWGRLLFLACDRCSYNSLRAINAVTAVIFSFLISSTSFALELQSDTAVATAGYYQLTWQADHAAAAYQIQEATDPDFSDTDLLYQGQDLATVVTGRSDGHYYYRARVIDTQGMPGQWSTPTAVKVKHHSLTRAFGFFTVGAIVFIAIFIAIATGNRKHRGKE